MAAVTPSPAPPVASARPEPAGRIGGVWWSAVIVFGVLLLRTWQTLAAPAFLDEELAGWVGQGNVLAPWHGFVYPLIRLAFLPGSPFLAQLVMIAGVALVAGFLASDRMAQAIPDERVRIAAGVGLAFLPFADARIYTTVINLHWFLAIYLVALALATPSRWDRLGALVAFSVPAAIFIAPLYVLRRRDRWVTGVVLAAAAVQLASILASPRTTGIPDIPMTLARIGIAPLGDHLGWVLVNVVTLGFALGTLIVASAFALRSSLPRSTVLAFGFVSLAIAGAGMATVTDPASPWEGVRYLVMGTWLLGLLAIAGLVKGRWPALVPAAAFAAGIGTTFAVNAH